MDLLHHLLDPTGIPGFYELTFSAHELLMSFFIDEATAPFMQPPARLSC